MNVVERYISSKSSTRNLNPLHYTVHHLLLTMASLFNDSDSQVSSLANIPPGEQEQIAMPSIYDPMAGLPADYVLRNFTNIKSLKKIAEDVLRDLEESDYQGNQWIVVLGLTQSACDRLSGDEPRLGDISYRITLDGSVGIFKVAPGWPHEGITGDFQTQLERLFGSMGVPLGDYAWRRAARYTGSISNRRKESDECLVPATRMPTGLTQGWPSMVIETGVSESLPRLRNDANWWFNYSNGLVRIVLVISVNKVLKELIIEKWQLLPPFSPNPITRAALNQIRQQLPAPMPPRVHQPAATQRSYDAQVIKITANNITGAPLVLPFLALFDRPPSGNEADIVLGLQELRYCTRLLF